MKKLLILIILLIVPIAFGHPCNETENTTIKILPEGYCDINLSLETDKNIYNNEEKILISNKLNEKNHNFTIEYWIEANNITIKDPVKTTNTNQKQFTPKLLETTYIKIKNNLTKIDCINVNNQTSNEVKVLVEVEKDPNPSITIEKIYLNRTKKINIGETLNSSVNIYTGNNSNYSILNYIENITEIKEYIINESFKLVELNLTLEIPNNCNITNGNYKFIVKSKDLEKSENITIINNCKNESQVNPKQQVLKNNTNMSESVINLMGNSITGRTIYESTNVKAKNVITYIFMVILAIIGIIIITSNKNTKVIKKSTEKWSSQLEQ